MYDVYTPIVADADVEISFEEAKKTALEALVVLGKDYTDVLEEAFSNRWLDVYENTGKRGGAYCTGNGWPHPYVLLNHKDNLDIQVRSCAGHVTGAVRRRCDHDGDLPIYPGPPRKGVIKDVYCSAKVESVEYGATVDVVAVCNPRLLGQLKDYIEGWQPPKEDWE